MMRCGTLAELIKLALETLPEAECRHVRIECGDTFLGYEAIRYAYYSVYFPLPRVGDRESPNCDVIPASCRDPS